MNADTTALPQAELLISAMEELNSAKSFKEFIAADAKLIDLGLKLRRGFYINRRSIHPARIELIRSAQSETELQEILQDINYDEIML